MTTAPVETALLLRVVMILGLLLLGSYQPLPQECLDHGDRPPA
jgi:hypothetical protein